MEKNTRTPNDLINESSPYLLQHAYNPVLWKPWNDDAWSKAASEDKLVVVSIGYSACHWCHVMEHESFEDDTVAQIMNDHFISIKVDREERPDVDQVYMDAVQIITGHGGWPLNAICLPDGRPVYAGTYFPKERWKEVLLFFVDAYRNRKSEMIERAEHITQGIKTFDVIEAAKDTTFSVEEIDRAYIHLLSAIDFVKGGRAGAPKFPMPVNYRSLAAYYFHQKNQRALEAITITLDNMMYGGIYDQAGGGFARYSVDADWEIPHFEKMLYDNAQLLSLYAEAFKLTGNEEYKRVVDEVCAFVERELTHNSGGCFSALDADSEGHEGKFYVWSYSELKEILGSDFEEFCRYFDVTTGGNFEGKINLVRTPPSKLNAAELAAANQRIRTFTNKLMAVRSNRIRPGLDDKVLTSWNALMLSGYVSAYKATGNEVYRNKSLSTAAFIKKEMLSTDFSLLRSWKNGRATISGFLDDYALTANAFIDLYEITFDENWLQLSKGLTDYAIQHFYNPSTKIFYYTSINDAPLIARKSETSDNVIPSSNAVMAEVLTRLGHVFYEDAYLNMARQMLLALKETASKHPSFYAHWLQQQLGYEKGIIEVAVAGQNAKEFALQLQQHFLPHSVITASVSASQLPLLKGKHPDSGTAIFICRNKTCGLPITTVEEALRQLKK